MSELIVLPAGKIITVAIAAKHRSLCGTGATIQFVSMVVSEEFGFIRNVDNVGIENGVSRDIRTRVFDGHNDVLSKLRNTGGVANTNHF